jgi:hypothetical protein
MIRDDIGPSAAERAAAPRFRDAPRAPRRIAFVLQPHGHDVGAVRHRRA